MSVREWSQLSFYAEEDPLKDTSDLPEIRPEKQNACFWTRRLAVLAAIGSMALVTFAITRTVTPRSNEHTGKQSWTQVKQQVVFVPSCNYDKEEFCPAWALFNNPEIHDVATDNLMKVGHGVLEPADRHVVKAAVAAGFKNISFQIQMRAPEIAKELNLVDLSEQQKNAVLVAMQLMSNPLLQSIGLDIGRAIYNFKSTNKQDLRSYIEAKLHPRLGEIMKLRSELIPEPLRDVWAGGQKQWTMTLDEENIRMMKPYNGEGKYSAVRGEPANGTVPQTKELTPFMSKTYSVLGGVLEEGRALLDIIELCGHLFGKHFEVPYWVTYLGGSIDVTSEFLSCEHHFVDPEDATLSATSALFCPLKFGTQGMDALKVAFDMDGTAPSILKTQPVAPAPPKFIMGSAPVTTSPMSGNNLHVIGA